MTASSPSDEPRVTESDVAVPDDGEEIAAREQTLLEQMGGISGVVYSTLPTLAFVPANSFWGLDVAIAVALGVAALVLGIQLLRREPVGPAFSGLIGVGVCALIAYLTGSAKGFFLAGIWQTAAYAVVFGASVLVRWPLVGVIWNGINGRGMAWRRDRRMLLAYDAATIVWTLVYGFRWFVQSSLYDSDQTLWLAVSRIAMGWPLTIAAFAITAGLVGWAGRGRAHD